MYMTKIYHDIRNFWHNYTQSNLQLKPLVRFVIALNVHVFKLPTCSWRVLTTGKIELVLFATSKHRADQIMAYVEELDKKAEELKSVMR